MDLRHFVNAVVAHKRVAIVGVVAAIALAFLAHVRVSPFGDPMLEYRQPVLWSSKVTAQLTQEGFPEGRVQDPGSRREVLVALAPLYARLANTDPVRKRMGRIGPIYGGVKIRPVVDENNVSLPLIEISSFTHQSRLAPIRARRQASAFMGYIAQQQAQNDVLPRNRVLLNVLSGPSDPAVVAPRKITLPVVVLLSVLILTGAVILVLENHRRSAARGRQATGDAGRKIVPEPQAGEAPREPTPMPSVARASQVAAVAEVPRPSRATPASRPQGTLGSEWPSNGKPHQADDTPTQDEAPANTPRAARRAHASRRRRQR